MNGTPDAAPDDPNVTLRCSGLHRYLGQGDGRVHVLRGVSFEAKRGQVYAIVGPSGCGKSTLLYLLGLLDQPDDGHIWIDRRLMSNSSDEERTAARGEHIGFVFQFHFLMQEFTALENVMMPMLKLGRLQPGEMEERARSLLTAVGLGRRPTGWARSSPAASSSGSRSRGPLPTRRRSSSPTSRRATSTPRIPRSSST